MSLLIQSSRVILNYMRIGAPAKPTFLTPREKSLFVNEHRRIDNLKKFRARVVNYALASGDPNIPAKVAALQIDRAQIRRKQLILSSNSYKEFSRMTKEADSREKLRRLKQENFKLIGK